MNYTLDFDKIGHRIGLYRRRMKISQEKLAELTGLSVGYISHIETGAKKASLETLVKVSSALNVTVDKLLLGNQINDDNSYPPEIKELLSDCNAFEKAVIYDTALNLKKSLRKNEDLSLKSLKDKYYE